MKRSVLRRLLGSSTVMNLALVTGWKHRNEVMTWARELPAIVKGPNRMGTVRATSQLAKSARQLDANRKAARGVKQVVREAGRSISRSAASARKGSKFADAELANPGLAQVETAMAPVNTQLAMTAAEVASAQN